MLTSPGNALYLFLLVYVIGELVPYINAGRDRIIALTSSDRPMIAVLIAVHCVTAIGSNFNHIFSVVANASYIAALFMLTGEFRSRRNTSIAKSAKKALGLFLLFLVPLVGLTITVLKGQEIAILVISVAAIAEAAVFCCALRKSIQVRFSSIYLRQAMFAATLALLSMGTRLFLVLSTEIYALNIGTEAEILFLLRLANAASFFLLVNAIANYQLQSIVEVESLRRVTAEDGTIQTLSSLAKARDNETGNHVVRTSEFVRLLGLRLARKDWLGAEDPAEYVKLMTAVAPLHDIGKVGIPDAILRKPGGLTPAEWETMQTHPLIGEAVLDAAVEGRRGQDGRMSQLFQVARDIAGGHHESWDGSGYPRGLAGEAIPKAARIMRVADIYDALTSERAYKRRWTHGEAVEEIKKLAGTHLDPTVVQAFLEVQHQFLDVALRHRDEARQEGPRGPVLPAQAADVAEKRQSA